MNSETLGIDNRAILGKLFQEAFGTVPVYITVPLGKQSQADMSGFNPRVLEEIEYDDPKLESIYGTPIVFPVLFKGGIYRVYNDKGQIVTKDFEDLWLPATTMVDFSRPKNIVKTNMLGANGTVKEIYGFDDWQIRIRTLCILGKLYAREYAEKLNEFNEIIEPIEVEGSIFSKKKIWRIVIEDFEEKSLEGRPNVIPIEMQCVSDDAIEFAITV